MISLGLITICFFFRWTLPFIVSFFLIVTFLFILKVCVFLYSTFFHCMYVWKNAPKLDFKTIKYWWFLNTHREFKIGRKILVFGLINLLIPPTQIYKKKKSELAFALFRGEALVLILGALMSASFEGVGILNSFCEFSGKQEQIWANKLYHVY